MGRKKFLLVVRKNRSRRANPYPLVISIPKARLPAPDLSSLDNRLQSSTIGNSWRVTTGFDEEGRKIVLYCLEMSRESPIIRSSITIRQNFTWQLSVFSIIITPRLCRALIGTPDCLDSVDKVIQMISLIEKCKICQGNADDKFIEVAKRRDGIFKSHSGMNITAHIDSTAFTYPTIRHNECEVLLHGERRYDRCQQCSNYRSSSLYTFSQRLLALSNDRLDPSSHANYTSLTTREKDVRMRNLQHSVRQCEKQVQYWKEKLEEAIETRSISDDTLSEDLHTIMTTENSSIMDQFPEGSFARLFWQQQFEAASRKTKEMKRGMHWDPLMVKWCIYLRHKSSGAYKLLRNSGCVLLPSQRTLRDYTHYVKATVGFSNEVDVQLAAAAKLDSCKEYEKCVVMLMDEMYIREELVYDKHNGSLIGFVNLGDINDHLLAFERSIADNAPAESLATTMMVFMVQGLLSSLSFPYAQFPCYKITGQRLFDPFWKAIYRLERMGFKVLGVTFDGASVNRRLIKIHKRVYTIGGLDCWTGLLDCPFTWHMRNYRSVAAFVYH